MLLTYDDKGEMTAAKGADVLTHLVKNTKPQTKNLTT